MNRDFDSYSVHGHGPQVSAMPVAVTTSSGHGFGWSLADSDGQPNGWCPPRDVAQSDAQNLKDGSGPSAGLRAEKCCKHSAAGVSESCSWSSQLGSGSGWF